MLEFELARILKLGEKLKGMMVGERNFWGFRVWVWVWWVIVRLEIVKGRDGEKKLREIRLRLVIMFEFGVYNRNCR